MVVRTRTNRANPNAACVAPVMRILKPAAAAHVGLFIHLAKKIASLSNYVEDSLVGRARGWRDRG